MSLVFLVYVLSVWISVYGCLRMLLHTLFTDYVGYEVIDKHFLGWTLCVDLFVTEVHLDLFVTGVYDIRCSTIAIWSK